MYPTVVCVSQHNSQKIKFSEDVLSVQYRNGEILDVVVADGVSGFHSPRIPNRMFPVADGEITGGQAVGRVLQQTFVNPPSDSLSIEDILRATNAKIGKFAATQCIPLDRSDELPATDVAAARVTPDAVEMVQCGDCFGVRQMRSGALIATENQAYEFERRLQPYRNRYSGGDFFIKAEEKFRQCRLDLTNKPRSRGGYATLNGQPEAADCWYSDVMDRKDVALLLLFTDGLVPAEYLFNETKMGRHMINAYRKGGWNAVIDAKGGPKNINEGTGIALEFLA